MLVGGAAGVRLGRAHVFVEGSWNMLVGAGSPRALASPIRVGGGVRLPLGPRLGLEALAEVSPSARPDAVRSDVPAGARTAAICRRAGSGVSVCRRRDAGWISGAGRDTGGAGSAAATIGAGGARAAGDAGARFRRPSRRSTSRRLRRAGSCAASCASFRGSTVDADVNVDGGDKDLRAEQGRFELDVTPGVHEVRISARGYTTQVRRVRVEENGVTLLNIDLKKAP